MRAHVPPALHQGTRRLINKVWNIIHKFRVKHRIQNCNEAVLHQGATEAAVADPKDLFHLRQMPPVQRLGGALGGRGLHASCSPTSRQGTPVFFRASTWPLVSHSAACEVLSNLLPRYAQAWDRQRFRVRVWGYIKRLPLYLESHVAEWFKMCALQIPIQIYCVPYCVRALYMMTLLYSRCSTHL
jgi:hypothetical protein